MDLRCSECARHPLLAVVRRDDDGRPYVHLKIYKQSRIYGEVVVTSGDLWLRCRECHRWHHIKIENVGVGFNPEELPDGYELVR